MNLLEDDTRKEEVKRVYKEIEDILKKAGLKQILEIICIILTIDV